MQLSELEQLCSKALTAAREAGDYIESNSTSIVQLESKTTTTSLASQVLTEVDIGSQTIVLKHLLPTLAEFNLALLSEEKLDDGSRLEKDYFWCIDPLDGTLSFLEGKSGYAVSIGLVSKSGKPLIGVIYDPKAETMYHAINSQGSFKNGQLWKAGLHSGPQKTFTWLMDRSMKRDPNYEKLKHLLGELAKVYGLELKEQHMGGGAMHAMQLCELQPACYLKPPKPDQGGGSLWDFAASACIVKEAGAHASDSFGNELDLNRAESTFMNHRGILYASDASLAQQLLRCFSALT